MTKRVLAAHFVRETDTLSKMPIVREVVLVDSKSLCSERFSSDMFKKVRRPVWPLDKTA